jgi:hypothetical protein
MGVNTNANNPTGVTPNQRYLDSSTTVNMQTGDNTGTTGITITYDGTGGFKAKVAARIKQSSLVSGNIAWIMA